MLGFYADYHDGNPKPVTFSSLDELNDEWDDYNPAEPLIKDEIIKKLLGEVVEMELVINELSKRFDEFNKNYAELCGEEEE